MFDGTPEQLGHLANVYKRSTNEPVTYTSVGIELSQAQRSALINVIPILEQTESGKIQDVSGDGQAWDNFKAISEGLNFFIHTLPVSIEVLELIPSSITHVELPKTQEVLLSFMSFLSCVISEANHYSADNKVTDTYKVFAEAGAALLLFYAQSFQEQPQMAEILKRYIPEIQLAQMILQHQPDEIIAQQAKAVNQRIQDYALQQIDREASTIDNDKIPIESLKKED